MSNFDLLGKRVHRRVGRQSVSGGMIDSAVIFAAKSTRRFNRQGDQEDPDDSACVLAQIPIVPCRGYEARVNSIVVEQHRDLIDIGEPIFRGINLVLIPCR